MWYKTSALINPNQIIFDYSDSQIDKETNNIYGTITAFINDKEIGYIDYEISHDDNSVHVTNIYVFPENQNQKIAQSLYKAVIDYSRNILNKNNIIIFGDIDNPAALQARTNAVQQSGGKLKNITAPTGNEQPTNLEEAIQYYNNPKNIKSLNVEHII